MIPETVNLNRIEIVRLSHSLVFFIFATTLEQIFSKCHLLGWELGVESLKLIMETE